MDFYEIKQINSLQTKTTPFLAEIGDVRASQNFDFSKTIGGAVKSGDYEQVGGQISVSKKILSLGTFKRGTTGSYENYAICQGASNSDIYKNISGTWTAQSQTLNNTQYGSFFSMPELDFFFYCTLGTDTIGYNGSSWSTSTNLTDAPKAKWGNSYNGRIYLANVDVSGTKYPAHFYWSSNAYAGSLSWSSSDYDILPERIEQIATIGEDQLMFTAHYIYRADAYIREPVDAIGTPNGKTVAVVRGIALFANKDGIFGTDGGKAQKVSSAIDPYFENLSGTSISSWRAGAVGNKYCLYVGNITEPETISNAVLTYDISQNKCEIYSLGSTVESMGTITDSNGQDRLYFGNANGEIFDLFEGTGQDTASFDASMELMPITPTGGVNTYRRLDIYGDKLNGIKVLCKTKKDDKWNSCGELRGYQSFVKLSGVGERLYLKFIHSGKGNNPEIQRLIIGYEPKYITSNQKL